MRKNIMFLHVYTINNYQEIVDELLRLLTPSIDNVIVCKVGDKEVKTNVGVIVNISKDYNSCEIETINYIREYCKNADINVLYAHTKGVCHPNNEYAAAWRKYMAHFNITNAIDCVEALKTYDVCGVDFRVDPCPHFCGNFWWSKSSHINTLPNPLLAKTLISHRHKAEFWLCNYNHNIKFKSFHSNNLNKLISLITWQ